MQPSALKIDSSLANHLMELALQEAKKGAQLGEVPVGAVLWQPDENGGKVLGTGHNRVEGYIQVSRHAEMVALEMASAQKGDWRLPGSILCVTIEPCTMCFGAIVLARVAAVIFGARQPRMGAFGSLYDLSVLAPDLRVISGIREAECQRLMQHFFLDVRES